MRSIVLFLLILNLCFAAWILFVRDAPPDMDAILEKQIADSYLDVPRLQLVSELVADESPLQTPGPEYAAEESCWFLGPFDEQQLASDLRTRLRATGVDIDVQGIATPVAPDFWVFVTPQPSRQDAVRLLRDLQRRDIDSFIITEGENENGISLGFYSSEKYAREVQSEHAGQSYQVDVQIVPREIDEFWGVIRAQEYDKLSAQAWERFQNENGGLSLEQKYCDIVASSDNLE